MRNSARQSTVFGLTLLLLFAVPAATPSVAGEPTEEEDGETGTVHEEADFHRNHFAGIVGWSHVSQGEDSVTLGMEYSRSLTRRIGVGAYIEISEGQFKADTVGLALVGHPTKNLVLIAGPGLERSLFEDREYLFRLGAGYTFHTKGVGVAPLAWVDFVDGHEIYFVGFAVGKAF